MKKIAVACLVVMMSLPLAACEGTDKADKKPVVSCEKEKYTEAGRAAKAAKGWFYTCGGPKCVVKTTTKIGGEAYKTTSRIREPGEFFISKRVTSWSSPNCGTIYRKRAK